jgi:phosphoribosyl 1,2-cyclic phosphodiesterase
MTIRDSDFFVRINGVLPEISEIGSPDFSKRAAEIYQTKSKVNTSCSLFAYSREADAGERYFHLLVDVGEGVVDSLLRGYAQVYGVEANRKLSSRNIGNNVEQSRKSGSPIGTSSATSLLIDTGNANSTEAYPNALLLTHAHDDHIKELPKLIKHFDSSNPLILYCTKSCFQQLKSKFPELFNADTPTIATSSASSDPKYILNLVEPDSTYEIGPFSVVPVQAFHGHDSEGSVVYVINYNHEGHERKIVIGWDFLELYPSDKNILWNPDLLILGTQSYNPHPETGMISVNDSFSFIKEWNARECYIVHYRGLLDAKEAQNQWFRGPTNPMTAEELQQTIDANLKIISSDGTFKMRVAEEGMLWTSRVDHLEKEVIEDSVEIESLDRYILRIKKDFENEMIKLVIEDKINRYDLRFVNPHLDWNNKNILYADGEKGMLAKGPELRLEVIPLDRRDKNQASWAVDVDVYKGRKNVFKNRILLTNLAGRRLQDFLIHNYIP